MEAKKQCRRVDRTFLAVEQVGPFDELQMEVGAWGTTVVLLVV